MRSTAASSGAEGPPESMITPLPSCSSATRYAFESHWSCIERSTITSRTISCAAVDQARLRSEYPVLERVAYMNAGTDGPVPRRGHDAAVERLRVELEGGRSGALYFEGLKDLATRLRERLAGFMGCDPGDLALTRSTTDGMSTALASLRDVGRGDEVLTSDEEHPGLLAPLELARRRNGFDVRLVPFDELANEVRPRTKLVACSHVSW